MRRLSRLLLVFWLQILNSIMVLVFVVITRDFSYVLIRFIRSVATLSQDISCVDPGSWSRVFLVFSLILPALFLLFPNFIRGLHVISALKSCHFLNLDFGFFNSRVFYGIIQSINFGYSGMS